MRNALSLVCLSATLVLFGCGHLEFKDSGPGLVYFEPKPYLAITTNTDCERTASVLVLPGDRKVLAFRGGYGTSDLSASLANGMIQSVGQKTDSKIPETITALGSLGAAARGPATAAPGTKPCAATAHVDLYPIDKGVPSKPALTFP